MSRRRSSRLPIPRSPLRRLALGFIVALAALAFYYYGARRALPPAAPPQPIRFSIEQEVVLGRQAAPYLIERYGGLNPDPQAQRLIERVGGRLVARSTAGEGPYRFTFYLLADAQTVNAFALPGGYVFLTTGLGARLRTEGEVAGVLAHQMGHVLGRHGATQLSGDRRDQALPEAATIAAYDPQRPDDDRYAGVIELIAQAVDMYYGHEAEREADTLAVRLMGEAGYDPRALLGVLEVLESVAGRPAFYNTHSTPAGRTEHIQHAIDRTFPDGIPAGMVK